MCASWVREDSSFLRRFYRENRDEFLLLTGFLTGFAVGYCAHLHFTTAGLPAQASLAPKLDSKHPEWVPRPRHEVEPVPDESILTSCTEDQNGCSEVHRVSTGSAIQAGLCSEECDSVASTSTESQHASFSDDLRKRTGIRHSQQGALVLPHYLQNAIEQTHFYSKEQRLALFNVNSALMLFHYNTQHKQAEELAKFIASRLTVHMDSMRKYEEEDCSSVVVRYSMLSLLELWDARPNVASVLFTRDHVQLEAHTRAHPQRHCEMARGLASFIVVFNVFPLIRA